MTATEEPDAMPRWRSGHAADCRSAILRFKSGPWLLILVKTAEIYDWYTDKQWYHLNKH